MIKKNENIRPVKGVILQDIFSLKRLGIKSNDYCGIYNDEDKEKTETSTLNLYLFG